MPETGRLDEQPIGPGLAQQPSQSDLERRAVDATDTAASHLAQCDTILRLGQQRGIQADLAELVDQHGPALA